MAAGGGCCWGRGIDGSPGDRPGDRVELRLDVAVPRRFVSATCTRHSAGHHWTRGRHTGSRYPYPGRQDTGLRRGVPERSAPYVANRDAQLVSVVDTAINQVTATIPTPAGPPQFLAFAPDGRKLYVTIFNDERTIHTIDVIDTASNTVIATIPQPARPFLTSDHFRWKTTFRPESRYRCGIGDRHRLQ